MKYSYIDVIYNRINNTMDKTILEHSLFEENNSITYLTNKKYHKYHLE